MGVDIAKAALAAGNAVVATARDADTVTAALGEHDDLLAVTLDITDPASAQAQMLPSFVDQHVVATEPFDRLPPRWGRRSRRTCSGR